MLTAIGVIIWIIMILLFIGVALILAWKILYFIGRLVLKLIEQITHGRLKFFNRDYIEPFYSDDPRPVKFF